MTAILFNGVRKINFYLLSLINIIMPKEENKVVLYGRRMFNDNLEALLIHLIENNYNSKYKIYCLLSKPEVYKNKYKYKNITFVKNTLSSIYHLITANNIFHTHSLSIVAFKTCRKQRIINLWHGSPLKYMGYYNKNIKRPIGAKSDNYFLVASEFFIPITLKSYGHFEEQVIMGGNPRNDLLFSSKNYKERLAIDSRYEKIILFMPTFRKSRAINKNDSTIDFPIISQNNIKYISNYLEENRVLLIIKPHPYQDELEVLNLNLPNIIKYTNGDLLEKDLCLYELIGQVDALITDYSSVYFDFLLTQKPIGFVLDDMDEYGDKRGFAIENPLELMPGEKIFSEEDFIKFIENICSGTDHFKEERKRINDLANKYQDNRNCERILEFLDITI